MLIYDDFDETVSSHWTNLLIRGGKAKVSKSILRLYFDSASEDKYTDADLNDCYGLSRSKYLWKPPLRMTIRARMSHPSGILQGAAGFGFWNWPFSNHGVLF